MNSRQRSVLSTFVLICFSAAIALAQITPGATPAPVYHAPVAPTKEVGFLGVQTSVSPTDFSVIIERVITGTPADLSGLRKGDVISKIDGRAVHSLCDMMQAVGSKNPGDVVVVNFIQNGESKEIKVVLSRHQEIVDALAPVAAKQAPVPVSTLTNPCDRLQKEYYDNALLGVYLNATGPALLNDVIPNTGAQKADLQKGDVIEQLDGKEIPTFTVLKSEVTARKPGDRVIVTYRRDGILHNVEAVLNSYADVNQEMVAKLSDECNKRSVEIPIAGERINRVEAVIATLSVSPNPTNGMLNVSLNGVDAQDLRVLVTDLIGNKIMDKQFQNSSTSFATSLDLSDAPKGVYVLSIQQGSKSFKEKIIVE